MTKAPERIWAQHDTAAHMDTLREMAVKPVDEVAQAFTLYLRADRIETLEAENKRLGEALTFYADLPAEWTIDPKGRSDDMRYGNLHLLGESARAALKE